MRLKNKERKWRPPVLQTGEEPGPCHLWLLESLASQKQFQHFWLFRKEGFKIKMHTCQKSARSLVWAWPALPFPKAVENAPPGTHRECLNCCVVSDTSRQVDHYLSRTTSLLPVERHTEWNRNQHRKPCSLPRGRKDPGKVKKILFILMGYAYNSPIEMNSMQRCWSLVG